MRALLDTDVILDLFLNRQGFVTDAAALWKANEQGRFEGFVSALTPVNVFYFTRKVSDLVAARGVVLKLITSLQVCGIDSQVLRDAEALPVKDYEDAVQVASAMAAGLDAIITRNVNDYKNSPLPVYSPTDFLARL
jgi:predicted nucleic acid-binding protein